MRHIDDDVLTLLALHEEQPDAEAAAHLRSCVQCRESLEQLERTVRAARSHDVTADLTPPPQRVWAAVQATLTESGELPDIPDQRRGDEDEPSARRRRRVPTWLAVAAGVAIGVAGAAIVETINGSDPPERPVIAAAELDALESSGVSGSAKVYRGDGGRQLRLQLDDAADAEGFREVWLLDAETGELVSLGVLTGTTANFGIPDGLDLDDYPLIDVSREPLDGDPTHSGDSIARGELDR